MMSMVGKRLFVYFTGAELPMALPINHGQPINGEGLYTLLCRVTGETPGGIWFRLEKIFDRNNSEMQQTDTLDSPEYFLSWSVIRRALIATREPDQESPKEPPKLFGFRQDNAVAVGRSEII
jgi:hypothetical protein